MSSIVSIRSMTTSIEDILIKGEVVYRSRCEPYKSLFKEGFRICFDVSDETGTIRVFGWDAEALEADEIISRGLTVLLWNVRVGYRTTKYNNTSHPFELTLLENWPPCVRVLSEKISIHPEKLTFLPLPEVKAAQEHAYFSIAGKITGTSKQFSGVGASRQNDYKGQHVYVSDKNGSTVTVAVFNEYFKVSEDLVGKSIAIMHCKYDDGYKTINPIGGYIIIDGVRII